MADLQAALDAANANVDATTIGALKMAYYNLRRAVDATAGAGMRNKSGIKGVSKFRAYAGLTKQGRNLLIKPKRDHIRKNLRKLIVLAQESLAASGSPGTGASAQPATRGGQHTARRAAARGASALRRSRGESPPPAPPPAPPLRSRARREMGKAIPTRRGRTRRTQQEEVQAATAAVTAAATTAEGASASAVSASLTASEACVTAAEAAAAAAPLRAVAASVAAATGTQSASAQSQIAAMAAQIAELTAQLDQLRVAAEANEKVGREAAEATEAAYASGDERAASVASDTVEVAEANATVLGDALAGTIQGIEDLSIAAGTMEEAKTQADARSLEAQASLAETSAEVQSTGSACEESAVAAAEAITAAEEAQEALGAAVVEAAEAQVELAEEQSVVAGILESAGFGPCEAAAQAVATTADGRPVIDLESDWCDLRPDEDPECKDEGKECVITTVNPEEGDGFGLCLGLGEETKSQDLEIDGVTLLKRDSLREDGRPVVMSVDAALSYELFRVKSVARGLAGGDQQAAFVRVPKLEVLQGTGGTCGQFVENFGRYMATAASNLSAAKVIIQLRSGAQEGQIVYQIVFANAQGKRLTLVLPADFEFACGMALGAGGTDATDNIASLENLVATWANSHCIEFDTEDLVTEAADSANAASEAARIAKAAEDIQAAAVAEREAAVAEREAAERVRKQAVEERKKKTAGVIAGESEQETTEMAIQGSKEELKVAQAAKAAQAEVLAAARGDVDSSSAELDVNVRDRNRLAARAEEGGALATIEPPSIKKDYASLVESIRACLGVISEPGESTAPPAPPATPADASSGQGAQARSQSLQMGFGTRDLSDSASFASDNDDRASFGEASDASFSDSDSVFSFFE